MSENNLPAPNPKPEASPGEFDFAQPPVDIPRVRKRSLKPKQAASLTPVEGIPPSARELQHEAPPLSSGQVRPEYTPGPGYDKNDEKDAGVKFTETSRPATPATPTARPSGSTFTRPTPTTSASKPTTSPHGTRPATLYYSSEKRKDKEETSPMKTTPSASPAPSTSTTASPARSTPSTIRAASVVDYRTNVERQSREQKSVGDLLSIVVYVLIGFFVLGASLSGYGTYVIFKQLRQQSVTVSDLDSRLSAQNSALTEQLKTTMTTLSDAQAQIAREQDLILKQQETINKLISAAQDNAAAVRTERATRAEETASIRERLRDLEYRGPTTQKY